MHTLKKFMLDPPPVPAVTAIYLADLGEARGKQELFTRQSPQKLKSLREHALIESVVSSNRIEGVTVDNSRVATVVFGTALLRDRDEEEVRGYKEALNLIHEQGSSLKIDEDTITRLHSLSRAGIGDAGMYKSRESDIIEKYPDGRERIRFKTVAAAETPGAMKAIVSYWDEMILDRKVHPLITMAAWNLDFLCIHPYRDGNGRVSRLALLLQLYHLGFEVGRYISIERIIEKTKDRYYETLEQSSRGWHEGGHDPWPYINYLLYTIKTACVEFENRVGQTKSPRGAKRQIVLEAVKDVTGEFSIGEIADRCPGVGIDMIRKILKEERSRGMVECIGRGRDAKWRKRG